MGAKPTSGCLAGLCCGELDCTYMTRTIALWSCGMRYEWSKLQCAWGLCYFHFVLTEDFEFLILVIGVKYCSHTFPLLKSILKFSFVLSAVK